MQQQRVSLHRGSSCPSLLATMPTATTTAHGYSSISLASDLYGHHSADSQRVSMSSLIDPHQYNDHQQQHHHHHHHPHRRSSPTSSCHHLQQCPLTEENLKQHTLKSSLGREGRHRRVKYYIESQIRLLRLQADLEGRRMAEMRSLVPLDTPSLEDEVIVLEDDCDLALQQSDEINDHTKSSPHQQQRRKKRLSDARQWVMQHIFKRNSSTKKNNEDDHNADHETSSPAPRRPVSITVQPHHHEDGILENDHTRILSYEQYQHEKRALIGQGLSGLSNPNIARALGVPVDDQHQASLASLLFSTSTSSSCTPPVSPSNSNPQQHIHCHSSTTLLPRKVILQHLLHYPTRNGIQESLCFQNQISIIIATNIIVILLHLLLQPILQPPHLMIPDSINIVIIGVTVNEEHNQWIA